MHGRWKLVWCIMEFMGNSNNDHCFEVKNWTQENLKFELTTNVFFIHVYKTKKTLNLAWTYEYTHNSTTPQLLNTKNTDQQK